MKVSAEKFVEIWQSSSTVKEVIERTGNNRRAVAFRSKQYRDLGIPLKYFRQPTKRLDVAKLTAIAEAIR